jgi:hypothetical protein
MRRDEAGISFWREIDHPEIIPGRKKLHLYLVYLLNQKGKVIEFFRDGWERRESTRRSTENVRETNVSQLLGHTPMRICTHPPLWRHAHGHGHAQASTSMWGQRVMPQHKTFLPPQQIVLQKKLLHILSISNRKPATSYIPQYVSQDHAGLISKRKTNGHF